MKGGGEDVEGVWKSYGGYYKRSGMVCSGGGVEGSGRGWKASGTVDEE